MNDDKRTLDASNEAFDERSIARKYGLKELVYPDSEQTKTLSQFLGNAVETARCGPVPKMAVMVMLEFLQAVLNRQHITKGPRMSHDEFDLLQTPYYLAARIVSKIVRERKEIAESRGKLYQTTYVSLNQFIELLRSLLDPGCYWLRMREIPEGVVEAMSALQEFALAYPELRRKGRAL
ncbi:MAG: hypothetical protein QOI24_2137 [Acidobacteriota bacterium]|nr:hypothetical protein [Acidobacteriota bacterium]